jgi:hypothetical protein
MKFPWQAQLFPGNAPFILLILRITWNEQFGEETVTPAKYLSLLITKTGNTWHLA